MVGTQGRFQDFAQWRPVTPATHIFKLEPRATLLPILPHEALDRVLFSRVYVLFKMSTFGEDHADVTPLESLVPGSNVMTRPDVKASAKTGSERSCGGDGQAFKIAIYGAVNVMMTIPCMYGYAAIIFRSATATTK